jgi:transcriptional regulator with XRE-family HTH domain
MVDPGDTVLRDLGRRVSELRRSREMTQETLAEEANVTVQYLQRIEGGRENLTVRSLVRLAKLLDVQVRELFRAPRSRRAPVGRPKAMRRPTRRAR